MAAGSKVLESMLYERKTSSSPAIKKRKECEYIVNRQGLFVVSFQEFFESMFLVTKIFAHVGPHLCFFGVFIC
ncbi:unnamed protein product [Gongylonema pulchrum]|uniref:Ovule protein n=1 Tax=Gongylonema pulchrum TaxID=637853 RepID=A0A183DBY9_9BILA|nr:unnamed protein product [Gongylonema pulchrum]